MTFWHQVANPTYKLEGKTHANNHLSEVCLYVQLYKVDTIQL